MRRPSVAAFVERLAAGLAVPGAEGGRVREVYHEASMRPECGRLRIREKREGTLRTLRRQPVKWCKSAIWLSDYVPANYGTGAIIIANSTTARDFDLQRKLIFDYSSYAKDGWKNRAYDTSLYRGERV